MSGPTVSLKWTNCNLSSSRSSLPQSDLVPENALTHHHIKLFYRIELQITIPISTSFVLDQVSGPDMPRMYAKEDDWGLNWSTITRLYLDEGRPLREVMDIMERNHSFYTT